MIKVIAGIIAVLALISIWVCGVGSMVSMGALILKWCGVGFVANMSSWLPVKFIVGYFVSFFTAAAAATLATLP